MVLTLCWPLVVAPGSLRQRAGVGCHSDLFPHQCLLRLCSGPSRASQRQQTESSGSKEHFLVRNRGAAFKSSVHGGSGNFTSMWVRKFQRDSALGQGLGALTKIGYGHGKEEYFKLREQCQERVAMSQPERASWLVQAYGVLAGEDVGRFRVLLWAVCCS